MEPTILEQAEEKIAADLQKEKVNLTVSALKDIKKLEKSIKNLNKRIVDIEKAESIAELYESRNSQTIKDNGYIVGSSTCLVGSGGFSTQTD